MGHASYRVGRRVDEPSGVGLHGGVCRRGAGAAADPVQGLRGLAAEHARGGADAGA
ncbi:hypothetical protein NYE80_09950 [Paenibacillus sp. FSL H7-0357]|uniref:hypothetical protein n=1 Tax=Paenibacillus sp. FSL H7-0357 TaxID=1536774 RepID=UPI001E5AC9DF|nr:hypothetical protein [Paenibacillus sp. FSL H7-0357]